MKRRKKRRNRLQGLFTVARRAYMKELSVKRRARGRAVLRIKGSHITYNWKDMASHTTGEKEVFKLVVSEDFLFNLVDLNDDLDDMPV